MSASSARDINSLPENLLLADTSVWAPAHRCNSINNDQSVPCASTSQDRAQLDQLCSILFPKSHVAERGDPQDGDIVHSFITFEDNKDKFRSRWSPPPRPALQCQSR